MKKITSYYWLLSLVGLLLFISPAPAAYAQDSSRVKQENELIQNEPFEIANIYENTLIYNGKIAPELTISFSVENKEERIEIPISSSGKYVIDFSQYKIKAGDSLIFFVSGNETVGYEEQSEKIVLEKEIGKEIIISQDETLEEKEFKKATTLSDIHVDTRRVSGKTALNAAIYLIKDKELTKPIYSDHITGAFNWEFDESSVERDEGEVLKFVFVSNGMVTVLEKMILKPTLEWEMRAAEISENTILPDLYQERKTYKGKTILLAKIEVSFLDQVLAEFRSDKDGEFTFDGQLFSAIPVGGSIIFTLTDNEGVFISIEKIMLPEKEQAEAEESELDTKPKDKRDVEQPMIEDKSPKPSIKEDKLVEVPASQSSIVEATTVPSESESLEIETRTDRSPEKETVEESDFAILVTIILVGTITMSGFLYKY
ncbi:hypothetical protein SAMN04488700_0412 [Carnobacterium iners]|uniref:Uncharacterized protein n=1 Tax=Carnobacterium iners TaxID=1073423 RepID=A0A1X7MQE7_9LACT|nr:hypothetical protein [Carnobacterium iners]SEL13606.1 hypothetical protein SAMN04488114_12915 [Carnobacterium iners]SMH27032.1 hypothetical protein SAMN04488700_0412 [Carnobacterium iners]